jgi:hypothetical protein
MPSINKAFLDLLKDDYNKFTTFIETGTLNGDTIFSVEPLFNSLYTIEVSNKYYTNTKQKYKGNKIQFLFGDSSLVFLNLLPTLTEPTIFFLDGHWSSGDTGRSAKDCPLIEEIEAIHSLFKEKAILIIDDVRLFGLSPRNSKLLGEDWSDISKQKILDILKDRIENVYHLDSDRAKNDRLIIHIKQT